MEKNSWDAPEACWVSDVSVAESVRECTMEDESVESKKVRDNPEPEIKCGNVN